LTPSFSPCGATPFPPSPSHCWGKKIVPHREKKGKNSGGGKKRSYREKQKKKKKKKIYLFAKKIH